MKVLSIRKVMIYFVRCFLIDLMLVISEIGVSNVVSRISRIDMLLMFILYLMFEN